MNKLINVAAVLACAAISNAAYADPIIPNSGFELGHVGFTSGYSYQSNLVPAGTEFVDTGSLIHNSNWTQNVTAHSGTEFLIVNGDATAGIPVYDATGIAVLPNTQYYFSAYVTSLYPVSPAILQFSINGIAINSALTISSNVGVWQELFVPWNSGASTTAEISLLNENTAFSGNDFGLDDIALSTSTPVPEPFTLSIFGAGLVGAAAMRRRKKKTEQA